jgi:hypothetical protein
MKSVIALSLAVLTSFAAASAHAGYYDVVRLSLVPEMENRGIKIDSVKLKPALAVQLKELPEKIKQAIFDLAVRNAELSVPVPVRARYTYDLAGNSWETMGTPDVYSREIFRNSQAITDLEEDLISVGELLQKVKFGKVETAIKLDRVSSRNWAYSLADARAKLGILQIANLNMFNPKSAAFQSVALHNLETSAIDSVQGFSTLDFAIVIDFESGRGPFQREYLLETPRFESALQVSPVGEGPWYRTEKGQKGSIFEIAVQAQRTHFMPRACRAAIGS